MNSNEVFPFFLSCNFFWFYIYICIPRSHNLSLSFHGLSIAHHLAYPVYLLLRNTAAYVRMENEEIKSDFVTPIKYLYTNTFEFCGYISWFKHPYVCVCVQCARLVTLRHECEKNENEILHQRISTEWTIPENEFIRSRHVFRRKKQSSNEMYNKIWRIHFAAPLLLHYCYCGGLLCTCTSSNNNNNNNKNIREAKQLRHQGIGGWRMSKWNSRMKTCWEQTTIN